jgi:glycosyltransferase involved in cell wall biosynthesis
MIHAHTVSVIICAYTEQRWSYLSAAVHSSSRQSYPAKEIIVIIDHNPALFERAKAAFPQATVIENEYPQGASGSRNSGIKVATGSIIACLDDDAIAAPDWIARLLEGYADPKIMGTGGYIAPRWPESGRPAWFPEEFNWVVGCSYRGLPTKEAPIRNLIGANMSIRREIFEAVGGFRDGIGRVGRYPIGCEETELCIRAKQRFPDKHFLFVPQARVTQIVPTWRATVQYFRDRCYAEGLSKALITQYVGHRDGLADERTYAVSTLPRGVLRGLGDALRGDLSGLARAGAIVLGLFTTAAGYVAAQTQQFVPSNNKQQPPITISSV